MTTTPRREVTLKVAGVPLINVYARHAAHADATRQLPDGTTGG